MLYTATTLIFQSLTSIVAKPGREQIEYRYFSIVDFLDRDQVSNVLCQFLKLENQEQCEYFSEELQGSYSPSLQQ